MMQTRRTVREFVRGASFADVCLRVKSIFKMNLFLHAFKKKAFLRVRV
jgi:hypothetical protein